MQLINLSVKLGDQFVKSLLKSFHICVLLWFYIGYYLWKLTDWGDTFSIIVFIFFLNFEWELSKSIIELAEKINSIPNVLEILICVVKIIILLYEILNCSNWLLQISNGFL